MIYKNLRLILNNMRENFDYDVLENIKKLQKKRGSDKDTRMDAIYHLCEEIGEAMGAYRKREWEYWHDLEGKPEGFIYECADIFISSLCGEILGFWNAEAVSVSYLTTMSERTLLFYMLRNVTAPGIRIKCSLANDLHHWFRSRQMGHLFERTIVEKLKYALEH